MDSQLRLDERFLVAFDKMIGDSFVIRFESFLTIAPAGVEDMDKEGTKFHMKAFMVLSTMDCAADDVRILKIKQIRLKVQVD